MPLYEYQCKNCNESFEKIVRFSEAEQLPPCPNCGSTDTRKKISAAAALGGSSSGSTGGGCGSGGGFT
ncbi:MAG: zinc ribbon domain-containing protein [Anaerolineae bacterium]|nr:zinc ribbon domain-containing protein [Anaerolineae bacterium]